MENNRGNSGDNFNNQNDPNNPNRNYGTGSSSSGMSNTGSNMSGSSYSGQSGSSSFNETSNMNSNMGSSSMGSTPSTSGTTGSSRMMTGMFRDRESAERAYNSLSTRGYTKDDVNLVMSDDTRKRHFGDHTKDTDLGDKALEGAGAGSAIGGTLGAIVGAVAAIGTSVALPGLGLIVAGPLAAGLAGAGAGGLTGGLLGALVGSGIPEDRAKEYESGVKEGGIVMGVTPRNEEDARYLESEWRNSHGESIYR
ncbi:MAG: hypothetical protein ACO1NZ_06735 [Adhaeribacter sp.]